MKTLKLLILFAFVAFGQTLSAQIVTVNNNTPLTNGVAIFNYNGGCPQTAVPFTAFSSSSAMSACTPINFVDVVISFEDNSCIPTLSYTLVLTFTTPAQTYVDCSGVPRSFALTQVGGDLFVDIN